MFDCVAAEDGLLIGKRREDKNSSSVHSELLFFTSAYHGCAHPDVGRSGNGFRGGIAACFCSADRSHAASNSKILRGG